jgi:hypothetical protein
VWCFNAESSRDPSPKTSRAISTDDIKKPLPSITETSELEKQVLALTDNNEMVQFPPVVSTNGTSKAASPHTYCFPVAQTNRATTKSNGYLLAETALTSTKNKVGRHLAAIPVHFEMFIIKICHVFLSSNWTLKSNG